MSLLPITFPMTFFCERLSISKLLELGSSGFHGTLYQISDATGIPTGESTGKVKPHIDYATSMGLMRSSYSDGVYSFSLTPFGEIVSSQDYLLSETLTQWLLHAHMCDPHEGALGWVKTITEWDSNEGRSLSYICAITGFSELNLRPLVQMYERRESLGNAQIIRVEGDKLYKNTAPKLTSWVRAYGALILSQLEVHFSSVGRDQVSVPEFLKITKLHSRFHWKYDDFIEILMSLAGIGIIQFSNLVEPPVFQGLQSSKMIWTTIFDDLV